MPSGEVDPLKFRKVANRLFGELALGLDPLLGKNYPYHLLYRHQNLVELLIYYPRCNILFSSNKITRYLWACVDITTQLDHIDIYARLYNKQRKTSKYFHPIQFSGVKSIPLANPDWAAEAAISIGRIIRQFENNEPIRIEYHQYLNR